MYAVIRTGGKQYRVTSGDVIAVEKLAGEAGGTINFGDVLLIGGGKTQTIGSPTIDGAFVAGTILEQGLGDKIIVFKKKRRKGYRRTKGHRQPETVVRITEVLPKGKKQAAKKAATTKSDQGADDAAAAGKKADVEAKNAAKPKAIAASAKAEEKAPPAVKAKSAGPAKTTKAKTTAAEPKAAAEKPATKKAAPKAKSKE